MAATAKRSCQRSVLYLFPYSQRCPIGSLCVAIDAKSNTQALCDVRNAAVHARVLSWVRWYGGRAQMSCIALDRRPTKPCASKLSGDVFANLRLECVQQSQVNYLMGYYCQVCAYMHGVPCANTYRYRYQLRRARTTAAFRIPQYSTIFLRGLRTICLKRGSRPGLRRAKVLTPDSDVSIGCLLPSPRN